MTTEDAKQYLTKRQIPRLFESLMTGLMYHRPIDHIQYLIDSLKRVQKNGSQEVSWNYFIDLRSTKSPLPPITPETAHQPSAKSIEKAPIKAEVFEDRLKTPTVPPIEPKLSLPDVPIILLMGNPGSSKDDMVAHLLEYYPKWEHVSMGNLLSSSINHYTNDAMWSGIADVIKNGDLVSDKIVTELFIGYMKSCNQPCDGFIITGYPRTSTQIQDFDRLIGRVDLVLLIDDSEISIPAKLKLRYETSGRADDSDDASKKKITIFKDITLPVIKEFDERDKLIIIDGEESADDIVGDLKEVLALVEKGENATNIAGLVNGSLRTSEVASIVSTRSKTAVTVPDNGRVPGLPTCPIILVAGGPGSDRAGHCARVLERYRGLAHISAGRLLRSEAEKRTGEKWALIADLINKGEMAPTETVVEILESHLKEHMNARAILIDGFPRDIDQINQLYISIGGIDAVMVLDMEEEYLAKRIAAKCQNDPVGLMAMSAKLNYYKNQTLLALKHFDDLGKLALLDGEQDDESVFYSMLRTIDAVLDGKPFPVGHLLY